MPSTSAVGQHFVLQKITNCESATPVEIQMIVCEWTLSVIPAGEKIDPKLPNHPQIFKVGRSCQKLLAPRSKIDLKISAEQSQIYPVPITPINSYYFC